MARRGADRRRQRRQPRRRVAQAQLRLGDTIEPLGLLGAQWVMPYYSFGKKFDRITKE